MLAGSGQHGGADVRPARIDANDFGRNAGLDERGHHAIGRPRFLRARA